MNEDSTSQNSYADLRDVNDPDYDPGTSGTAESSDTGKVNLTTFLKNAKRGLEELAPELMRDGGGMESKARQFTGLCAVLKKAGYIKDDIDLVIPRSRLESACKRDGKKRLDELSKRSPIGEFGV